MVGYWKAPQPMENHESSRTTGLYDHSGDELTAQEIQKVGWDGI